jgi:hypothetical protein
MPHSHVTCTECASRLDNRLPPQEKSWVLIWELRELALNGSCREAMLEGGAVSILAALLAEEDMPAPAKANAAAALKV